MDTTSTTTATADEKRTHFLFRRSADPVLATMFMTWSMMTNNSYKPTRAAEIVCSRNCTAEIVVKAFSYLSSCSMNIRHEVHKGALQKPSFVIGLMMLSHL